MYALCLSFWRYYINYLILFHCRALFSGVYLSFLLWSFLFIVYASPYLLSFVLCFPSYLLLVFRYLISVSS